MKVKTKLKKGDPVMIIAGGNKNKRANKGQVGNVRGFAGDRVLVEGLNVFTKHQRATQPGQPSGKIPKEAPVHISNVMYYVEKIKRPVRIVTSTLDDGTRVRGYKDPTSKEFVQL